MKLDVINPASLLPSNPTGDGTPLIARGPVRPTEVTPVFNVPEQGSRLDEKRERNKEKNPSVEKSKEAKEPNELPDAFTLVLPKEFSELFNHFLFVKEQEVVSHQREFREKMGVQQYEVYSKSYKQNPSLYSERKNEHADVLRYHYNRPGKRFVGYM